jgi:hypothetical protein
MIQQVILSGPRVSVPGNGSAVLATLSQMADSRRTFRWTSMHCFGNANTPRTKIVSDIPGLDFDYSLPSLPPQTPAVRVPLYFTSPGYAQGTIRAFNDAAGAGNAAVTIFGYCYDVWRPEIMRPSRWSNPFVRSTGSTPVSLTTNGSNVLTFTAPRVGSGIRLYALSVGVAAFGTGVLCDFNGTDSDPGPFTLVTPGTYPLLVLVRPLQTCTLFMKPLSGLPTLGATVWGWTIP